MAKKIKFRPVTRLKKLICPFCEGTRVPSYKESLVIGRFLSERGRIIGRDRTGVCPKHQKRLAIEIKRARHLALLPFVSR